MRTFETLINEALHHTDQANNVAFDDSRNETQTAIAYALIAIAQELHRMNERQADKVEQRLDLAEARVERLANLAG